MRLRPLVPSLIVALALTACATAPPKPHGIMNTHVYPHSHDAVWQRLLTIASSYGMYVTAADRAVGVISAERAVMAPSRGGTIHNWADCGAVSVLERPLSQLVDFNFVVQPEGARTRVTMNARYTELRQDLHRNTYRVICTSTGALEYQLLLQLQRH